MTICSCPISQRYALPICPDLNEETNKVLDNLAELTAKATLPIIEAWKGVGVQYMHVAGLPKVELETTPEDVSNDALNAELALRVSRKLVNSEAVAAVALMHIGDKNSMCIELAGTEDERNEGAAALARLLCSDVVEDARNGTTEASLSMNTWVARKLCTLTQQKLSCPEYVPQCNLDSRPLTARVIRQLDSVGEEILSPVERLMWKIQDLSLRFRRPETEPLGISKILLRLAGWRGV